MEEKIPQHRQLVSSTSLIPQRFELWLHRVQSSPKNNKRRTSCGAAGEEREVKAASIYMFYKEIHRDRFLGLPPPLSLKLSFSFFSIPRSGPAAVMPGCENRHPPTLFPPPPILASLSLLSSNALLNIFLLISPHELLDFFTKKYI